MAKFKYLIALILLVSIGSGALEPYSRTSYFTFRVPENFVVVNDTSEKTSEKVIMINSMEIIQIGVDYSFGYEGKVYPQNCIMVDGQEVLIYGYGDIYKADWISGDTNISVLAKLDTPKPLYDFLESFTYYYNTTEIVVKPSGFQDDIIVYTVYNSTYQRSTIYYQDIILYSIDKDIVEKIKGLNAATKWGGGH